MTPPAPVRVRHSINDGVAEVTSGLVTRTVWVAWGTPAAVQAECLQLDGDRDAVRGATVQAALTRLLALARNP